MIDTVKFVDRLAELSKKNQSGFETAQEQIGNINQSQLELSGYLESIYAINARAEELYLPLVKEGTVNSSSSGLIVLPAGFNKLKRLTYMAGSVGKPTYHMNQNQVDVLRRIPQRRASLEKSRILYRRNSDGIQVEPKQTLPFEWAYTIYPPDAAIAYTYTQVNGEPKRTVASQTDMVWGMDCFNILLYMVLEKMGIATRDMVLNEFAKVGIQKELVDLKN